MLCRGMDVVTKTEGSQGFLDAGNKEMLYYLFLLLK